MATKEYFKLEGEPQPLSEASAKFLDENLQLNEAFFKSWDAFCTKLDDTGKLLNEMINGKPANKVHSLSITDSKSQAA